MVSPELLYEELKKNRITFFTGVPDSHLNDFCNYLIQTQPERNIIAANEGNAVGIAAGHYFATREVPLVYMQNSGMGNTINPLVSLADERVYAVPMILLIGWRGQPGKGDWAQHELQGELTTKLLDDMQIPYSIMEDDNDRIPELIQKAASYAESNRKSYALIVPKGVLSGKKENIRDDSYPLSREEAIEMLLDYFPEDTIFSATTGRATRELFYLRQGRGENLSHDFLNVGSMGHASSVALGIALEKPERTVVCLDGDAAAIMHMGAFSMMKRVQVPNFVHVVLNNGAHESVGGQPSVGHLVDFTGIAAACGYQTVGHPVNSGEELLESLKELDGKGPAFLDIRIRKGLKGELPPLRFSHREAIDQLITELNRERG